MFDADVSGVFEGLGDWGGGLENYGEVPIRLCGTGRL